MGSQPPPCGPECGPSGCDVKKQPETPKDKNPSRINDLGFPGGITWDVRRRPGTASHVVDHFPIGRRTRLRGIAPAPSRSRSRIGGIRVSMAPPYLAPAVRSAYHSSMSVWLLRKAVKDSSLQQCQRPARKFASVDGLRTGIFRFAWVPFLDRRPVRGAAIPLLSAPAPALGIDDADSTPTASKVISHALLHSDSFLFICCAPSPSR